VVSVVEAMVIIQYSVLVVRSGYTGSMYKVMKTFVCRGCVNTVTGTGLKSVDIGVNANLELVSVDGEADVAVKIRI